MEDFEHMWPFVVSPSDMSPPFRVCACCLRHPSLIESHDFRKNGASLDGGQIVNLLDARLYTRASSRGVRARKTSMTVMLEA